MMWTGPREQSVSYARIATCRVQVVNLELPSDGAHYCHRAGRTGRIGRHGNVISLVEPNVSCSHSNILQTLGASALVQLAR